MLENSRKLKLSHFLLSMCELAKAALNNKANYQLIQYSSVTQFCPTLCDPMNRSTPGLPVHHQLRSSLGLMSIESVMPSSHLILCRPGAHILSLQVCNSAWFLTDCTFDLGYPHSLWVWSFALLLAYISNLLFYVLSYTLCHVSNSKLFTVFTVLPPWDILAFTRGKQPGPLCL